MLNVEGRHPAVQEFADMFEVDHLDPGLPREVSALFGEQAQQLLDLLPDGLGLTRALHRLWEAKNEAVFLAVRTQRKADEA
ncbi:hypothetical protein [Actinosynnema sp. NPDC023587]|uniref:hypothetical protein n=1 Tax=Actinosynnema sp. NPDC023587 TaxID=3154695 RepID=UPI003408405D